VLHEEEAGEIRQSRAYGTGRAGKPDEGPPSTPRFRKGGADLTDLLVGLLELFGELFDGTHETFDFAFETANVALESGIGHDN
jgi:hypothetical protein